MASGSGTSDAVELSLVKTRKPKQGNQQQGPHPSSDQVDLKWKRHALRLLVLWALVFAAYSNSFHGDFVFDNEAAIGEDPRIQSATLDNVGRIFTEGYWHVNAASGLYRPFTTLTYLLNYSLLGNGSDPAGYHALNLGIHLINVLFVYVLGSLLLEDAWMALALAALWGVHPLTTESVTNIVGRADLLAAFGLLGGLICYVKGLSAQGRQRVAWIAGVVAAQTIGLLSKENAAVLPGIMLLFDITWPALASWKKRAPVYAVLTLPLVVFFLLRRQLHAPMFIPFSENPLVRADFLTARITAVKMIGKYLWLFVWPAHLSPDYTYNAVPIFDWHISQWEDLKAFIAITACAAALGFAIRMYRVSKPAFFLLLFFFIALAPTSNLLILIGSIGAERFLYLPIVGLAGCAVLAIRSLSARAASSQPRIAWSVIAACCVVLGARTYARNKDWQDELHLWSSAVEVCPNGARPHMNLGRALEQIPGRLPEAIAQYETAVRIDPESAQAHFNLGNGYTQAPGRMVDAIREYQAAIRIQPGSAEAHNNLAHALSQVPGHTDEAIDEWKTAIRLNPNHARAHYNLANAYAQSGRMQVAIAEWESAVRINPEIADAHYNLGNAYSQMPARLSDAIAEYRQAVRIDPSLAQAHNNLANALARAPNGISQAIVEWQAALRLQPDLAEAHYNLGSALAEVPGRTTDAIAELEAGLRIKPNPQMQRLLDQLRGAQR